MQKSRSLDPDLAAAWLITANGAIRVRDGLTLYCKRAGGASNIAGIPMNTPIPIRHWIECKSLVVHLYSEGETNADALAAVIEVLGA